MLKPSSSIQQYTKISFCVALWIYIFIASYSLYHVTTILPVCLLPCLVFVMRKNFALQSFKQTLAIFFSWGLIFLFSLMQGVFPAPVNYILLLCGCVYIICSYDERKSIADLFLRGYTIILAISFIEYLLYLNGFSLQLAVLNRPGPTMYQYIQLPFNLIQKPTSNVGLTRFQSLANEPGLVGTLNALLLFNINRKEYKKEYYILIITSLFTLSLAFYVLFVFYIVSSLRSIRNIGFAIIIIMGIYGIYLLNQDRPEVKYVQYRIELGEDADNRTSDQFETIFKQFRASNFKWLGKGMDSLLQMNITDGGNDGIKKLTYEVGYVGILLLFISYSYVICKNRRSNAERIIFLIAFWASFYQRAGLLSPFYALLIAMPYLDKKPLKSLKGNYLY